MNPTAAGTERYNPEIQREITPPMSAKGRFEMTSSASLMFLKVKNSRSRMRPIATGPMVMSFAMARCWFSNCPPHVR
jgi:hypothetical protein